MTNVIEIKHAKEAPRAARSSMETLIISVDQMNEWQIPPCQRPKRINSKVEILATEIKRDETIPGIITLGRIGKSSTLYIVDGQHRLEAFKLSGLTEAIADIRIIHCDSMAELAQEFVQLNSSLVRMRPDDVLRGLEPLSRAMQRIRAECGYVGYGQLRRGDESG